MKSKLLKERAKKISEERCGMTTDDDAMSELKFGRYWSKEERKKHIEKVRDHKRKRECMMKAKMETLKEAEEKKEINIVELSHRKMMKHKKQESVRQFCDCAGDAGSRKSSDRRENVQPAAVRDDSLILSAL